VLPAYLAESARTDPLPEFQAWVHELPGTVRELGERWSLRLGDPYQPGGQCSWVAPVRTAAGDDLVLKVGWRHDEAEHEGEGLRAWAGRGAVRLFDAHTAGSTSALLIERCLPGTPLGQALPEPDQDTVVAGLLRQLWQGPTDGYPFRPLHGMCDVWADEFEQRYDPSAGMLDPGLARAGMDLLRGLPREGGRHVLLATDLYAGNVLAAQREPWLAIDPKPFVGDPTYDAVQHMLNCDRRLATAPVSLARRMSDLLGLDAARLRAWLFARCVQESIDDPSLRGVAARLAPS
jgi:streptomycin 6-kinase